MRLKWVYEASQTLGGQHFKAFSSNRCECDWTIKDNRYNLKNNGFDFKNRYGQAKSWGLGLGYGNIKSDFLQEVVVHKS